MVRRLDQARVQLAQAKEAKRNGNDETMRDLLDDAVVNAWRFGEYAINVLLELGGLKRERHHKQAERAEELRAAGMLRQDYKKRPENLQSYRLKAAYASYSSAPSVHYASHDVENCLDAMNELKEEVVEQLRARGKLT